MRTTITIDDALYNRALELADPSMDKADLFREALATCMRVRTAQRLAALAATAPLMPEIPRRRSDASDQALAMRAAGRGVRRHRFHPDHATA